MDNKTQQIYLRGIILRKLKDISLLTYFNVLHIINEYIAKTKKRNIRDVSFSESCREVRGSSVNPELASESFC